MIPSVRYAAYGDRVTLYAHPDAASISGYAATAMRWAVSVGILNGSGGNLDPQGTATRAQVAAMVSRYGDKL